MRNDKKGYIKADKLTLLQKLGLSDAQWQILALRIQKESIQMLRGLEVLSRIEQKEAKTRSAA